MLSFISFILVCVGSFNWFTIGILQYDFVAGLFGSQSNVFSRLIYALVGVASIIVIVNMIKNKGKFVVSFKKASDEYEDYKEDKKIEKKKKLARAYETSDDFYNIKKEGRDSDKTSLERALEDEDKKNK